MKRSLDFIVRFSSLGDIVLCAGFTEKLALENSSQPGREIIFATQKSFQDIIGTFSKTPKATWGLASSSLSIFFQTLEHLQKEHEREKINAIRVFDLHGVPKSLAFRMATLLFSLKNRISYQSFKSPKKSLRRWLILLFKKDLLGKRFVYAEHQKLLKASTQVFYPQLAKRHIEIAPGTTPLLIAPDSQHWKKKWPVTYWEKFFQLAKTELPNAEFTLVGGPGIFPQDLLDSLQESFGDRFKNRIGLHPLSDLSRIASAHVLTLCGNSAWQHISESVGVPVISMPGPIVKGFGFAPFLPTSRELEVQLPCRPCTRHGGGACHLKGDDFHACMKHIRPELLIQNTKDALRNAKLTL